MRSMRSSYTLYIFNVGMHSRGIYTSNKFPRCAECMEYLFAFGLNLWEMLAKYSIHSVHLGLGDEKKLVYPPQFDHGT